MDIQPIPEGRKRQVAFMKRKSGLLKKAMELSLLCQCDMGAFTSSLAPPHAIILDPLVRIIACVWWGKQRCSRLYKLWKQRWPRALCRRRAWTPFRW